MRKSGFASPEAFMPDSDRTLARQNAALTRQLLEWVASTPRTYTQALEVWRSSCPRHTIWEDALEAGLIDCGDGSSSVLVLTQRGRGLLGAKVDTH
jgi:hypothetical protein